MADSDHKDDNEVNDSELTCEELRDFFRKMFEEHKRDSKLISVFEKQSL